MMFPKLNVYSCPIWSCWDRVCLEITSRVVRRSCKVPGVLLQAIPFICSAFCSLLHLLSLPWCSTGPQACPLQHKHYSQASVLLFLLCQVFWDLTSSSRAEFYLTPGKAIYLLCSLFSLPSLKTNVCLNCEYVIKPQARHRHKYFRALTVSCSSSVVSSVNTAQCLPAI